MNIYEVQNWISVSDIKTLEYSEYWNDEEKEKEKPWYILDGDVTKMEHYLQKTGLLRQINQCVDVLKHIAI